MDIFRNFFHGLKNVKNSNLAIEGNHKFIK
jgi:hypothetical protein